jgi:hypothetical protein
VLETNDIKEKIIDILQDDPLYSVLRDTPLEETLYTDPYLADIIEKKFYSTPEVASWFDITDAQLRYYIKPFEHYIFEDMEDNPSTATVFRLNLPSILKLRMILLLKDEYRVKGLKQILGIDENGYIMRNKYAPTTALAKPDELANKVEVLSNVVQQMMKTGLFNIQMDDENGGMHITINEEYLTKDMKLLSAQSAEQMSEIQERTEKIEKEQEGIKQQIQDMKVRQRMDIAIKIRERQIESNLINKLRNKALQLFMEEKKWIVFSKLFRSSHFELEKEKFIEAYIKQHLQENLLEEFRKYNNKNN